MNTNGRLFLDLDAPVVEYMLSSARPDGLVRIPVMMLGDWHQGPKAVPITGATIDQIVNNFSAQHVDVPLSYEHTIEHPLAAAGQPIPAAGWLKELDAAPDANGVLWGWAELTAEARQLIQSQQYRYISPAYATQYPNHETGKNQGATLLSVALTNRPFLPMPAVKCSAAALPAAAETDQIPAQAGTKEAKVALFKKANVSPITSGEKKGNLLVEHSDIPAKAGDGTDQSFYVDPSEAQQALSDVNGAPAAQMSAAQRAKVDRIVLMSGIQGATELTDEVVTAVAAKIGAGASAPNVVTMSAVPTNDKGEREYLKLAVPAGAVVSGDVFRAMQADAELSAAVTQGKILPAQRQHFAVIAMRDPDLFRAMVAGMNPQVALGISGTGAPGRDVIGLSAEEVAVAEQFGTTKEQLLAAKKIIQAQ